MGTPTWTPLSPSGAPPAPRAGAALVLDPVRDRLILFGGGQPILGSDQQTWALSLGDTMKWEQVTTSGTPPDGLYGRAGIYDPVGDRFVTISGVSHSTPVALALADTVPAWTWLAPSGPPDEPPGRYINGMAYDPVRRALVICGGYVNNSLDDTWSFSFDLSMWTRLAPIGEDLPARTDHAATIDPMSGRVFGGRDPFDRGDVWAMDLEGTAGWDSIAAEGTPPDVASDVAAACDTRRHRMLYFGGESTAHGISNAVWALDLDGTPTWSELITSGTPPSLSHSRRPSATTADGSCARSETASSSFLRTSSPRGRRSPGTRVVESPSGSARKTCARRQAGTARACTVASCSSSRSAPNNSCTSRSPLHRSGAPTSSTPRPSPRGPLLVSTSSSRR